MFTAITFEDIKLNNNKTKAILFSRFKGPIAKL